MPGEGTDSPRTEREDHLHEPTLGICMRTLVQQISNTGPSWLYAAFPTACPCALTSYRRTSLLQDATARMSAVGENAIAETESVGRFATSTSLGSTVTAGRAPAKKDMADERAGGGRVIARRGEETETPAANEQGSTTTR